MADFKELLGKYIDADKLDSVVEELNQELPKNFIPKGRFNEVNEELKITKSALEENKKATETLSIKANSIEEYEKKIAELTKAHADSEANAHNQIASITKKTQLKELLLVNNAHKDSLDLLVEKYADGVEIIDGKLSKTDELLATIKAERAGLFIQTQSNSADQGGHTNPPSEDDDARLRKLYGLKKK